MCYINNMKKFYILLILVLITIKPVKAEIFDLYQCIDTDNFIGDDGKRLDREEVKWSLKNFEKYNQTLKIQQSEYIDFLEWSLEKLIRDGGSKARIGNLKNWNIPYEKEILQKQKEFKLDKSFWFQNVSSLTTDEYNKILSYKPYKFKTFDRIAITVNTELGEITWIIVYSDDTISKLYTEARYFLKTAETERKKKLAQGRIKSIKKIHTLKYTIDEYAGGLLIGSKVRKPENKIIIDLNTLEVTFEEGVGDTLHRVCNSTLSIASGDDNSGSSSGTAFFVSKTGHLLTNNHVVEGCSISKITYRNKDFDTKLIARDKNLDLALLKANLKPKSFINFSKEGAKKLNKIYVAGYPLGKGLSDDLKISSGIVSSLKGFEDNSNEIQIDAPINPGNSGGPIINENGDLVAIAVSGLAKDQTEGINFGIKSSAAELFLKSNKVSPSKSLYSRTKDNDDLLKILEDGTVYTYCN